MLAAAQPDPFDKFMARLKAATEAVSSQNESTQQQSTAARKAVKTLSDSNTRLRAAVEEDGLTQRYRRMVGEIKALKRPQSVVDKINEDREDEEPPSED